VAVPSTVATASDEKGNNGQTINHFQKMQKHELVKWTMARLLPVMSSMLSTFQVPVVSGFHAIWQLPPCWKTAPGLGSVGVTSAKATNAIERTKVERAVRENIGEEILCMWWWKKE
jgi:hypothetical protein